MVYPRAKPHASTIDLLTSITPSPLDFCDAVTMGGKQVGAFSKMARLMLSKAVVRLRGETRSAFVMIAWSVHLTPPDRILSSKCFNMSLSVSLAPCLAFSRM